MTANDLIRRGDVMAELVAARILYVDECKMDRHLAHVAINLCAINIRNIPAICQIAPIE